MKLVGSNAERQMREELLRSNIALRSGDYARLAEALEGENINLASAFVLNWIPEQAEDIYSILISAAEVVTIEVPRGKGKILLEREELKRYEGKCSKVQRLKIAVARYLIESTASK